MNLDFIGLVVVVALGLVGVGVMYALLNAYRHSRPMAGTGELGRILEVDTEGRPEIVLNSRETTRTYLGRPPHISDTGIYHLANEYDFDCEYSPKNHCFLLTDQTNRFMGRAKRIYHLSTDQIVGKTEAEKRKEFQRVRYSVMNRRAKNEKARRKATRLAKKEAQHATS